VRDDFPREVKAVLASRAAGRCCNPDCGAVTSGPGLAPGTAVNVGVAAHITGASPGGFRYDPALTSAQRAAERNGIWLCQTCAKLIDSDLARYTVDVLHQWKAVAEGHAASMLASGAGSVGGKVWSPYAARPLLDRPYQPLPPGAPEAWLLQPRFGVVPYMGRDSLLADLDAWCLEDRSFSIAVVTGEAGSGKSRLASEACVRMQARGWEAGLVPRAESLADFSPVSSALLVVDYPEQRIAVLGASLEQLASRVTGPPVRVLLLARQPARGSHWWADLDRASRSTATGFTRLQCDLADYALSLPQRQEHAAAALTAFSRYLGVDEARVVPGVTHEEFANPLLVHMAALLAVRGESSQADPSLSVREAVLAHLLGRERNRWEHLRVRHQLADLHETHALRAVLAAVLAGPSASQAPDILGALPEFSGPAQRERRGRIGYWLAELYPGEPLMASFGPDLLIEKLLGAAAESEAGLGEVVAALHRHPVTDAHHLSRLLTALRLAAEQSMPVYAVLHEYLASNLAALARRALDDDGISDLAGTLESALAFCSEGKDPGLKLAFACSEFQGVAPERHERCAQLLCTTMRLGLTVFRAMAEIHPDEEGISVLAVGLTQLIHRSGQAGWDEEALALNLELVQVRRQLVVLAPGLHRADLPFDLTNLATAHAKVGQFQDALCAAEEAVTLQRELAADGKPSDQDQLAISLFRLSAVQAEMARYDEALAGNTEALPRLRRLAEQNEARYLPVLADALIHRGNILIGQHQHDEGLAAISEAIELREHVGIGQPQSDDYTPSLQYDLHNAARAKANLGRYEDALADAAHAVKIGRKSYAVNARRWRSILIRNLVQLAGLHVHLARPVDAMSVIEEAVALARQGTKDDLALSLVHLINVLVRLNRCTDALPVCREAIALLRGLAESDSRQLPLLTETLVDHSQVLDGLELLSDAVDAAREAVDVGRRLDSSERLTLARALINLGDRYASLDRIPEALDSTKEGTGLFQPDDREWALVPSFAKLADRHARLGHRGEALDAALRAVQLGEANAVRNGLPPSSLTSPMPCAC
jgi:tetratricopeptide (TPR) repeat protein